MLIRTGLLHVPTLDADAAAAVRAVLAQAGLNAPVLLERSVGFSRNWIAETLRDWCDEEELDLILTIGGTQPAPGPAAGECVPEATLDVLERHLPGLPEAMRAEAEVERSLALLDRSIAGIRSRTLILNLPAGAAAAPFLAAVADVLPAALALLREELAAAAPEPPEPPRPGLNADEFAAYLQRKKPS